MPYAFCLTITCINETRNSTYHIGLSQPGFQCSGQVGLDRSADLEKERNPMNLYVAKSNHVVRDKSLDFTLCFFLFSWRIEGKETCSFSPAPRLKTLIQGRLILILMGHLVKSVRV